MNVYTCIDHDGHWVGVASVIIAPTEEDARDLLSQTLGDCGLNGEKLFTLHKLDLSKPQAVVLCDGDY